jgi:hypothetical protein
MIYMYENNSFLIFDINYAFLEEKKFHVVTEKWVTNLTQI